MRPRRLASLLPLLVACSTVDPPAPRAPRALDPEPSADAEAAPAKTYACGDAAACVEAGRKAQEAKQHEKAREHFAAACDQGSGAGCGALGSLVQEVDKDEPGAVALWLKACDLGQMDGCFNAAERVRHDKPKDATVLYARACKGAGDDQMLVGLACGRGGVHAYQSGDEAVAAELARASCNDKRVAGCNLLGVLTLEGGGGLAPDKDKAVMLFDKACEAGDASGCDNKRKVESSLDVPGANITMGSITADGFTLTDMKCKAEGAGLGALVMGPAVAGAIGKKKAALDACAPKGANVRVRWTASGGKVTAAEAKAGDPKIEACVAKVLKAVPAALDGTCAASIHVGK